MGALNASFVESAPQVPARAGELARICRDFRREDAFPVSIYTLVGGFCATRIEVVANKAAKHVVRYEVVRAAPERGRPWVARARAARLPQARAGGRCMARAPVPEGPRRADPSAGARALRGLCQQHQPQDLTES